MKEGKPLYPPDDEALLKIVEASGIIDNIKENIPMGSFHIIETNMQPRVMAEVNPRRTIRRFVEIDIKLRAYL